jgi:LCP family protein required for cell wall assembly
MSTPTTHVAGMSATIQRSMSDAPRRPRGPSRRGERPEYTVYRSRPRLLDRLRRGDEPEFRGLAPLREHRERRRLARRRKPWTWQRVVKYVLAAIGAWLALSLVLFLFSAQFQQEHVSDAANAALDGAGPLPFVPNTILVIGSDARPRGTHEGGANVVGQPSRSDTLMLIRTGGFKSARLSIPRDTVVDIPGHGRDKINAAYAIGGTALTITTVKRYLGIEVNHVVEVNFENFPKFIDSMGGVDVELPSCVRAKLDGGDAAGGTTLDLHKGTNHLDGRHALALSRVRSNRCRPGENDLDRAKRQQLVLAAIKRRLLSVPTFFRLPWVSWNAPQAIRSDMGGPTLLGLFAALGTSGTPAPRVLKPSGIETTPGGGQGLVVSDDERRAEVKQLLAG